MTKRNKRKKVAGGFTLLPHYLTDSPAFRALTPNAVWLFLQVLRKKRVPQMDHILNIPAGQKEAISIPYSTFAHKMGSRRLRKSIRELVACGFLDLIHQGGLERNCSQYTLSFRWKSMDEGEVKNAIEEMQEHEKQKKSKSWKDGALDKDG